MTYCRVFGGVAREGFCKTGSYRRDAEVKEHVDLMLPISKVSLDFTVIEDLYFVFNIFMEYNEL